MISVVKQLKFLMIFILPMGLDAQSFTGKQKVMDPNRSIFSFMGSTVEISNDYAFVSASESPYDTAGANPIGQSGIVLVYKRALGPGAEITVFQQVIALASDATFRWLDCENNYAVISGIVNDTAGFQPGTYAMEITQNGCVDTLRCVVLRPTGTKDLLTADQLEIFSNSSSGNFTIMIDPSARLIGFEIYSAEGAHLKSYPLKGEHRTITSNYQTAFIILWPYPKEVSK